MQREKKEARISILHSLKAGFLKLCFNHINDTITPFLAAVFPSSLQLAGLGIEDCGGQGCPAVLHGEEHGQRLFLRGCSSAARPFKRVFEFWSTSLRSSSPAARQTFQVAKGGFSTAVLRLTENAASLNLPLRLVGFLSLSDPRFCGAAAPPSPLGERLPPHLPRSRCPNPPAVRVPGCSGHCCPGSTAARASPCAGAPQHFAPFIAESHRVKRVSRNRARSKQSPQAELEN